MKTIDNIVQVPISEINTDRFQPRGNIKQANLNSMVEDIRLHGQILPLIVTPYIIKGKDELLVGRQAIGKAGVKFWLIDGERRYRALGTLNLKSANCLVKYDLTVLEMYELQFITNTKRVPVTIEEMAKAVERYRIQLLKEEPKADPIKKLVQLTGFSQTYFKDVVAITEEPVVVRKQIYENKLGGYFPKELRANTRNITQPDAQRAIQSVVRNIYVADSKVGKKHSPNALRIVKHDLTKIGNNTSLTLVEKRGASRQTMTRLLHGNDVGQDRRSNFAFYRKKVEDFGDEVRRWNLEGLSENERDYLSGQLIHLADLLRERRRIKFGIGKQKTRV